MSVYSDVDAFINGLSDIEMVGLYLIVIFVFIFIFLSRNIGFSPIMAIPGIVFISTVLIAFILIFYQLANDFWNFSSFYEEKINEYVVFSFLLFIFLFYLIILYLYTFSPITALYKRRFPSSIFFFIALFAISENVYSILKETGNQEKNDSIENIYTYLDEFFNYKLTIPQSDFEIYLWIAFTLLSAIMIMIMAHRLTFVFYMWDEELIFFIPYLFIILLAITIIFFSDIIIEDVTLSFNNMTINLAVILSVVKIIGWIIGLTKLSYDNREMLEKVGENKILFAISQGKYKRKKAYSICMNNLYELSDEWQDNRRLAVKGLGYVGGISSVHYLEKLLNDDDTTVRLYAVESLVRIGGDIVIGPLIDALDNDDYIIRSKAIQALGDIGGERAVEPLLELLDYDESNRWLAAEALGKIGSERAIEELSDVQFEDRLAFYKAQEAIKKINRSKKSKRR